MTKLQAIRESIKHWMLDIVRPLKTDEICLNTSSGISHSLIVWRSNNKIVECYSDECALCVFNENICFDCSLFLLTCRACGEDKASTYMDFYRKPILITAKDMVRALVCTYWAEIDKLEEN